MSDSADGGEQGGPSEGPPVDTNRTRRRGRFVELLVAMVAIAGELDLSVVLQRVVDLAAEQVGARYGALGVRGTDGRLEHFLWTGIGAEQAARIGPFPDGHGLLGEPRRRSGPLRVDDIDRHPAAAGFPPHHPPMRSFLGVPIGDGRRNLGSLYLADRRDGKPFDSDDESLLALFAAAASIALLNARRYETSREQERWLAANYGLTHHLLAGTDPDSQLTTIIRTARRLTDADFAVVFHVDQTREHMVIRTADGVEAESTLGRVLPMDASRAGDVFRSGTPVVVADMWEDTRRAPWLSDTLPPVGPCALVPLGLADDALGVVMVSRLRGRSPFPTVALRMLETFASQAAVALRLARERTWREQVALYADRERIAHDLHDQVIQRVFATGMLLQGTARMVVLPEVRERLLRAVGDLDETVRQIRATIYQLEEPPAGSVEDVRSALLSVTDQAADALGFAPSVRFNLNPDVELPVRLREHLVAAVRELLANVARHARAGRADVELTVGSGRLRLTVADNGIGLPAGGRRSGLRNLAERALSLGGEMTAEARPGGGTLVVWQVPLHA
ncbi:sensor histidine kinase [Actinocatenispora comari]|uniref:Histidine kinase n=1 Tax=Actinocatenispora comari TaxID=2807577 RepID=A0A8J4AHC1_9ACTN|nr:GAF domain-containing sensor histidine kinase [Actinocatenispora comari]GIL31259.1 histidine kinase [Actinocatenispora comari]